jgi:glycosyltransferase involved in cell wall biosynthesis
MCAYAIVTPARDEAELLPDLAKDVVGQTAAASAWIVVDNGSTDETRAVAEQLAAQHSWVRCMAIPGPGRPTRGGPVVKAFEAGLAELVDLPEVVVKLDADVRLPNDYFERLLDAFDHDPRLGIASGTRLEPDAEHWRVRRVTGTMVPAQARAYRRECLRMISPLERCVGWDHVDQLKSSIHGWRNLEVSELFFRHVRPGGTRDGNDYWLLQGAAAHYLGYRPTYVLFRALHRASRDPNAARMIAGYVSATMHRSPRCSDPSVVDKTREQQRWSNLPQRIRELQGRRPDPG